MNFTSDQFPQICLEFFSLRQGNVGVPRKNVNIGQKKVLKESMNCVFLRPNSARLVALPSILNNCLSHSFILLIFPFTMDPLDIY
jgi:hypothetical protein